MPASNTRTTKKTTSARPSKVARPAPVAMNFDTWSRSDTIDPFPIVIGGERYESVDPMEIDYRELNKALDATAEDVFELLFPEDHEAILENKIPVGALVEFNQAVVVHFGLEDFIAAQS